jgi:hypothetical protein
MSRTFAVHVVKEFTMSIVPNVAPKLRISRTAHQTGYGSDRYKCVVYLTPEERAAARAGETIFYRAARLSGGNRGTQWRKVLPLHSGLMAPRVPSADEVTALHAATGLK